MTSDEIFQLMATGPTPETDQIMDSGVFNRSICGYIIESMLVAGFAQEEIQKAVIAFSCVLDDIDAASARWIHDQFVEGKLPISK